MQPAVKKTGSELKFATNLGISTIPLGFWLQLRIIFVSKLQLIENESIFLRIIDVTSYHLDWAGAGGALFINNGTVIANNVDFTDNRATGGNGSTGARGGSAERTGENGDSGGIANVNGTAFADTTPANGGNGGARGSRNGESGRSGTGGQDGSFGNGGGAGGGGGGGESGGLQEGRGGFGGDGGDGGFGAGGGAGGGAGSNPNRRRRRRTALGGDGGNGGEFGGDGGDGVDVPPNGSRGPAVRGGGGAGLGGAIFVDEGAELILLNSNFSGNSATGGTGANNGRGRGNDIFVQDDATVSQANTNVATGNNLNNGRVFGDISNFTLPTINLNPGDDLSEITQGGSFNLSLSAALPIDLIVNYTVTGTATNGEDFTIPTSVTIPAGATEDSIALEVIDDRLFDPNENIIITLDDSPLYNLGAANSATATIIDDEPNITLAATDGLEGGDNGEFIFNLNPNAPDSRQLSFRISGGTAELDTDYRLLDANGELLVSDDEGNFALDISGQDSVVVRVDATGNSGSIPDFDDGTAEGNETVEITLNDINEDINEDETVEISLGDDGNPNNNQYGGGGSTITATIVDNDSPPTVNVVAADNPSEANFTPGFFDLNFSNPLLSNGIENDDQDALFNFTLGGSATRDEDYNLVLIANDTKQDINGNSFSLPEGTASARIEVEPIDDNVADPDENVTFTLEVGEGYDLGGQTSAELTIEDSGVAEDPGVAIVQINESGGSTDLIEGQTTDIYTIALTSQPTSDVMIDFATDNQIDSIDSVTFTPENFGTTQIIRVVSVDDDIVTGDRSSTISHTATSDDGTYDGIAVSNVTANIVENDVPGIVVGNATNLQVSEGEEGVTYTIALASQPTSNVTIDFGISNDLQTIAPLTFTPDNWDIPQDVTVTATIDTEVEEVEFQNISHVLTSDDPIYNNLAVADVPIAINELSFDNIETASGLNESLNSLQDSIDAQFRAIEIPFIGSLEFLAPDLIGSFQDNLINGIQTGGVLSADSLSDIIETTIGDALGVDVDVIAAISEEETTFDVTVAQEFNLASIDLDADLGLPGLGVDVDGSGDLTFDYEFNLGFGTSEEFGFFVDTEKTSFTAGVGLGLSDDFQATGNLGFLQLDLTNDEENPTAASADFTLGLNDLDAGEDLDGDRLRSTELDNASFDELRGIFNPSASANVNLGLNAVTSIEADTAFPSFSFDLAGEFPVLNYEDGEITNLQAPTIAFNNVELDLGSFLSDFAQPVIGRINDIIDPFRPVIDFLNSDTEILNDLNIASDFDGNDNGEISVLELALGIAELGGSTPIANFIPFFNAIVDLSNFAEDLSNLEDGDSIIIDIGSYELGNFDASDPNADSSSVAVNETNSADSLDQQLNNAPNNSNSNNQRNITRNLIDDGNLEIPLLTNPFSAIDLLLGQDVPLFTYDLPALEVRFDVRQEFTIFGPIGGLLAGDFNVGLDLAFGFDTFGLNQWAANNFDPAESFRVADGFFVSDRENADGTGEDVDELVAAATIALGAGLNIGFAGGYVTGGLEGLIGLDLVDGGEVNGTDDGRLRASEIFDRISTPFELFQLSGIVNAFLGAEVSFFGSKVWEQRIATFPLAEFSVGPRGNSFSSVSDGVIAGGTVFFDANFDGVQDPDEPSTFTNIDGSYDLEIPFYTFDLNSNGVIDPEEGRVVTINGIDISTSLPQSAPIITTPDATVATPLTSLTTEIAEPDFDEAQAAVINSFGLTADANLYDDETATADLSVFGTQSQLQNLIILATQIISATSFAGQTIEGSEILTQDGLIYLDNNNNQQFDEGDLEAVINDDGDRFFDLNGNAQLDGNELSSPINEAEIASAMIQAIANRVNNGETPDLSNPTTVTGIINEAVTVVATEDPNITLDEAAIANLTTTIVERNLTIDNILDSTFLDEVEQRQQISNQHVFIDANDNGIQDSDEPFSLVDETGSDELDITLFDTNENGVLDVRVVVTGESPEFEFVDSNANGVLDNDELFSAINPSGDSNLEIDFIDANDNGVQDNNESFLITSPLNPDGVEIAIAPFDTNENGVLEPEERANVVVEGTPLDRWSFVDSNDNGEFDRGELFSVVFADGTDALDPFVEPAKVFVEAAESAELAGGFQHLVTNPLATISRLVVESADTETAQKQVKQSLGLPEDVDLLNFDPLLAASEQDPNWLEVYAAQVQVQNIIVQIGALTGSSDTDIIDAVSEMIVDADNFDLSDPTQIEEIINEVAPELEDNTVDGAATVITESNERIDDITADRTTEDLDKAIEIAQVQQIAQGKTPEDLQQLRTGEEGVAEVVDDNTGAKLTEQIDNTEAIDPTIRPDLNNDRPIAEPDTATTEINTSVTIDVLNNDSDPEGDAIEIVDIFASDNAEVVINPDNTLTYTPNIGFAGEDIIFYAIQDGNGSVDNNIVTVTVAQNLVVANRSNINIQGTEQADDITGTSQGNVITGLGGMDRFIYNELGDREDTITDFTPGEDNIVLTNLLDSIDYLGSDPIADGIVQFSSSGSDTLLLIDRDGLGDLQPQSLINLRDIAIEDLNNQNNFEF